MSRPLDDPAVTVVVCTRDRPALLVDCLAAVGRAVGPGDEILVVDSASADAAAVGRVVEDSPALLVRASRPGLSVARNVGVGAARHDVVAFTDDDCRPRPDWVDALRAHFFDDDLAFVTGAALPAGEARLPVSVVVGTERRHFGPGDDPATCGAGANMAFRVGALDAIGGFDEALGAGTAMRAGEDLDVFDRLLATGHRGVYEPDAVVEHVQWRSDGEAVRLGWGYGLGAGAVAAKRIRTGRGWGLLARRLGQDGIGAVVTAIRNRHATGAATSLLQVLGVLAGAVRALRLPVDGQRFR